MKIPFSCLRSAACHIVVTSSDARICSQGRAGRPYWSTSSAAISCFWVAI